MSDQKWTHGPWEVYPIVDVELPCAGVCEVEGRYETFTIMAPYASSDDTAYEEPLPVAHLIAAAPELYEALEHAVASQPQDDSCEAWVSDARAALAKARGETQ